MTTVSFPHCLSWSGQSCMQTNSWKQVMQLEINVGSELPLTLFNVTHPGLASVKVHLFWQPTSHPRRQRDRDRTRGRERETSYFYKAFNKMHSVIQVWTFLRTVSTRGLSICAREVYFVLKMRFLCALICNPWKVQHRWGRIFQPGPGGGWKLSCRLLPIARLSCSSSDSPPVYWSESQ